MIVHCLQDALACYAQSGASPLEHVLCFLDMGLPQRAADRAAAYIKEDANLSEILAPAQVHAGETIISKGSFVLRYVFIVIVQTFNALEAVLKVSHLCSCTFTQLMITLILTMNKLNPSSCIVYSLAAWSVGELGGSLQAVPG